MGLHPVSSNYFVPVLNFKVRVVSANETGPGPTVQYTQTDLENYFITPEDSGSGAAERRLSFQDVLNMMIF